MIRLIIPILLVIITKKILKLLIKTITEKKIKKTTNKKINTTQCQVCKVYKEEEKLENKNGKNICKK